MNGISSMDWKDVLDTVATAKQIFDIVRLVDPLKVCPVEIDSAGNIQEQEQIKCYSVWNFASRCSNCTSLCAFDKECAVSKTEKMGKNTYHVLSYAIYVTDGRGEQKKLVLEMLSKTLQEEESEKDTILVVDDQDVNRMIIRKILEKNYQVVEAGDGKEALEVLEKKYQRISAVVLDLVMPGFDGYTTLRFMQSDSRFSNIPVLVTTGDNERKTEKKSLEAGAWDFIPKPVNRDTLELRLKNIIGRSQFDVQKSEQYMAEHDRLTGLYNRSKFFDEVRQIYGEKQEESYVFLRVDLDRFRLYNAYFGEQEGNRLLMHLAGVIREVCDSFPGAICGRIEADIFGVFCVYHEENVMTLQKRIVSQLKEYNEAYYIEPSIGVFLPGDREITVEEMYNRASMAAESCKHQYMENVGFYDEKMADKILNEQEVMNEAERALEEGQFEVYLQPKVDVKTEEVQGAEVLSRWVHPKKGMVLPGKFVPVFENNGFVGRLDFYMWEKTCKLLRKWLDEGLNPVPVSVNVSRANLYHPNLLELIKEKLNKYQIPTELLQLEVTESAFMDNQQMMSQKVEQLQKNGFTVLMDDFGSGYSSLNTLKDIPVDILKVDMKFLGKSDDGRGERILASIVRMTAWLGIKVIVEGVETAEQRNFLEGIGCEYAQGYFYAKPMPWQEYEELLRHLKDNPRRENTGSATNGILKELWEINGELKRVFYTITEPAALFGYDGKEIVLLKGNGEYNRVLRNEEGTFLLENGDRHIPDNYVANIRSCFGECVSSQKMTSCDYLRIEENGKNCWYRMRLQYVTRMGENDVIMATYQDISQEKMLEQEVRRYKLYSRKKKSWTKMLVVDDSDISRFTIRELFKDRFEILEAKNGEEALHKLSVHYKEIAIILLDMNMPVMDGKQFLELKNATEQFEDIPVVVVSADDRQEKQIDMLQNGVNDYVTKPFVPEIVERRVLNVIEYNSRFQSMLKEYHKNALPSQGGTQGETGMKE